MKAGPLSAFVNKVFLEHKVPKLTGSMAFWHSGSTGSSQQRPHCPQSLDYLLSDLHREGLPSSFLKFSSTDRETRTPYAHQGSGQLIQGQGTQTDQLGHAGRLREGAQVSTALTSGRRPMVSQREKGALSRRKEGTPAKDSKIGKLPCMYLKQEWETK